MTGPAAPGQPPATGAPVTSWRVRHAVIRAVQWTGGNIADVQALTRLKNFGLVDPESRAHSDDPECDAELFGGEHSTWTGVKPGQWIVKGITGILFAVADEKFREDYEPEPPATGAQDRTPGQAAFAAYYGRQSGATLLLDESWALQSAASRDDWEAAAQAVLSDAFPGLRRQRDEARRERNEALDRLIALPQGMKDAMRQTGALEAERNELRALIDAGQPTLASQLLDTRADRDRLRRERDEAVDRAAEVGGERNRFADALETIADGRHGGRHEPWVVIAREALDGHGGTGAA